MKEPFDDSRLNLQEVAFIGTGPLTLLKAYLLAKSNPDINITMFDSSDQIGGAWYSDISPRGNEIECGCHIWSHVPKAYRYIEKELGVKLYKWDIKPIFVKGNLKVGYPLKLSLHSYKAFFKTLLTFNWKHFKVLAQDPEINYSLFGKTNLYPKLGSPELIKALKDRIDSLPNISIKLNTQIEAFAVNEKVQLQNNLESYEFDHVFFTYVSHIKSLTLSNQEIKPESTQVDYIHFLISLDKPLLKALSYWRLLDDKIIHRITDISYQTKFAENLLLVGIKGTAYDKEKEATLVDHVASVLKNKKLINSTFRIEKIKTHIFPTYYLAKDTLQALAKYPDQITLLHTTDLTCGFYFLLEKEKLFFKNA